MNFDTMVKLLIIDDEPLVRESIAAYLEDSEFDVIQASNGKVGLELVSTEAPDIVLTDLDMPILDGYSVLTEVAKISEEIPVIIITGIGDVQSAVKASRAGAWDFILKPIPNMAVVEHAIHQNLLKKKLIQENREYKEDLELKIQQRTRDLEFQTRELQKSNTQLSREIETRKLAEARLRQAKNRISSLRRFSNRISEFSDEGLLLSAALEELNKNIYVSGSVLLYSFSLDCFTRYRMGLPAADFLKKPLTYDHLKKLFSNRSQEVSVINRTNDQWLIDLYGEEYPEAEIAQGHFVFLRAGSLHQHVICLYRDPLYGKFDDSDIDFIKHMIAEVNITYRNIQVLRENIWLENELKSTDLSYMLFRPKQSSRVPGFEIATASVQSAGFDRNSYQIVSHGQDRTGLLLTDVPGSGVSALMYNSKGLELLNELESVSDPSAVIARFNDRLHTGFQPNRNLTFSYFVLDPQNKTVVYAQLGDKSLTLSHIGKHGAKNLAANCFPFIQIKEADGASVFANRNFQFQKGEIILSLPARVCRIENQAKKTIDPEQISQIILNSASEKAATILDNIILELDDFFMNTGLSEEDKLNIALVKRMS